MSALTLMPPRLDDLVRVTHGLTPKDAAAAWDRAVQWATLTEGIAQPGRAQWAWDGLCKRCVGASAAVTALYVHPARSPRAARRDCHHTHDGQRCLLRPGHPGLCTAADGTQWEPAADEVAS